MKRIFVWALILSSCNSVPVVKENNQEQKPSNVALKKNMTLWQCNNRWIKDKKVQYREYNLQGDVTKWIQYDSIGDICELFEYVYEGSKKMTETKKYCNGKLESTISYKYDSLNRVKKEETYDEHGKLSQFVTYRYMGHKIKPCSMESKTIDDSSVYSTIDYTYFPNDSLKEEVETSAGSWFGTYIYNYDASGNMIYMGAQLDGGVGLVEYHYIYENGLLAKDSVNAPNSPTEYHIIEYQFFQ